MSADMQGSLPQENDQIDLEKAILVRERNTRKQEPEKLKDNLYSGVLDSDGKGIKTVKETILIRV